MTSSNLAQITKCTVNFEVLYFLVTKLYQDNIYTACWEMSVISTAISAGCFMWCHIKVSWSPQLALPHNVIISSALHGSPRACNSYSERVAIVRKINSIFCGDWMDAMCKLLSFATVILPVCPYCLSFVLSGEGDMAGATRVTMTYHFGSWCGTWDG